MMKNIRKISMIILCISSLSACDLYGNYERSSRGRSLKGKCDIAYAQTLHGTNFSLLKVNERPINYRLLKPGVFHTTDHNSNRVNLKINKAGIIEESYCG